MSDLKAEIHKEIAQNYRQQFVDGTNAWCRYVLAWSLHKKFWCECPHCLGHKTLTILDAVSLDRVQGIPCRDCNGTGIRQDNFAEKLMLVVSELSEAMEADRSNQGSLPDEKCPGFTKLEIEAADVVIRIMNLAGAYGWRLGEAIVAKMDYNETRPIKHGGKKY